jgi:hypothetical protein
VEITVLIRVTVAPGSDVDRVEEVIAAAGQRAMQQAMAEAGRALEAEAAACPACGGTDLRPSGRALRVVWTRFGKVRLTIRRVRCGACRYRFRPAAPALAVLAGGNLTARLRAACVQAGRSWPYATAAGVLHDLCGATVSAEQVRRVTVAAGRQEAHRQWDAASSVITPTMPAVRAERGHALRAPIGRAEGPDWLLVGLDGGWVASRDQPGGMEGKVGVVATAAAPVGRHGRRRLTRRRYVATFGPAAAAGCLTYAAAHALGGEQAERQTVVGDGADGIKAQAALHFPTATTILDWGHLERAVHKAIRAARPGRAHRALRRQAHRLIPALLWDGEVEAAATELADLVPADAEPVAALDDALSYLATHRAWLGDDGAWRAVGEPVGSGMIERAVALVINRRMKRRGMRWRRACATAIVALRVAILNADWDQRCAPAPAA